MSTLARGLRSHSESAFTMLELLVCVSILGILVAIGIPNISEMNAQLSASRDVRAIAQTLTMLRSEAIRLRTNIFVNVNSTSVTWDIHNDGSIDGTLTLNKRSGLTGTALPSFTITGLGLAPSLGGTRTIQVTNKGSAITVTINRNGHVDI